MRTLILCGGRGTRALPHTLEVPKPLLDVGGRPLLRHVMDVYASQGHADFVLAAGYQPALVEAFAAALPADWKVEVVDTGLDTGTGARVARCRHLLDRTSFVTYGDGLADVDLDALLRFHHAHPGAATVTTVPLPSPFGVVEADAGDGRVRRFVEKPRLPDRWINGGFLVVDDRAVDGGCWGDDLERDALAALATAGELFAYRHAGFWRSLDTYKDALELAALCTAADAAGAPPPWIRS